MIATKFKAPKREAKSAKGGAKGGAAQPLDRLACLRACSEDDDMMLSTTSGVIVRQRVANVSRQGRPATGVLLQKLDGGTTITEVALVASNPPESQPPLESAE